MGRQFNSFLFYLFILLKIFPLAVVSIEFFYGKSVEDELKGIKPPGLMPHTVEGLGSSGLRSYLINQSNAQGSVINRIHPRG